jgi:hypothetical protein
MTSTTSKPVASQLKEYFEMSAADFMKQWKELTDQDKNDLRQGVENGTWSY